MKEKKTEENYFVLDAQLPIVLVSKIAETLAKLPDEVKEFVDKNVQFIEGRASTICKEQIIEKPFFIILRTNNSEFTIAHEVAHAWLNHDERKADSTTYVKNQKEANQLAKKWLKSS
jgi:Zn-dependent peptidase ImmA (M78 family)